MSIKSMQNQTATLLANGKILLVGGGSGAEAGSADAELYDPKAEALTSTGSMSATRVGHTATLLPDGKVLVAGGAPSVGMYGELASAELYDPATGAFARTGSMTAGRIGHTATLLKNGKVLIAGGYEGYLEGAINWADIYDPNTGTFSPTGSMTAARSEHTATLLTDGRVLIAGGMSGPINHRLPLDSAELYDPTTGTFSPTGKLAGTRSEQTATLLSDGRVLLIGGRGSYPPVSLSSAELYDPKAGDFTLTGDLGESLTRHQATLLQDGRVLVTGGMPGGSSTFGYGPCSVYDPKTGQFHATVNMSDGRAGHTATLLPDGSVLVVGGESGSYLRAEVYQ
jgi:hypothetical protein